MGGSFACVGTMLTAHRLSRYELAGVDGKSPAFSVRDPAVPVGIRDVHPRGRSDWLP
jgi:hypothetical protein